MVGVNFIGGEDKSLAKPEYFHSINRNIKLYITSKRGDNWRNVKYYCTGQILNMIVKLYNVDNIFI